MFQGAWSLHRIIQGTGSMKGLAKFEKLNESFSPYELLYAEDGVFEFDNGTKLDTHKEYIYYLDNEQLSVYFIHNKKRESLFHMLDLKQLNENGNSYLLATARHHCSQDIYDIKYEIYNNDEFKIIYTVNGPTKDYVSKTYFKRNN